MKLLKDYSSNIGCNSAETAFEYFVKTINRSITYWDYFVNWEKVFGNIQAIEMDLNTLNYLVGKDNIEEEFKVLLKRHGTIARLIPILLASRENNFTILDSYIGGNFVYEDFYFENKEQLSDIEIDKACRFAKNAGILEIFQAKKVKSIPDYVLGVEVGLDSNGRKNRGGSTMERIVEELLKPICERNGISYMVQADAARIRAEWGLNLRVDKSSRRFDFALRKSSKLCLIETNYYGGGGSKLKATAGEYKSLYDFLSEDGHAFVWITDGKGWATTLRPLEETFRHINYTLNLDMLSKGLLEAILNNEL
ncbi:MAG: type II restriction endonuclease [Nitrospirae bacterium]|nr:type II restriction endonuclease [Nitrospirota bacterium]